MIDKGVVKRNFSRCAPYYDKYATIQNLCALRLIGKIETTNLRHILELGCGTGNYTRLLRKKFPQAKIRAIDISSEMIKVAQEKMNQKDIDFVAADAEAAYLQENFGLVSSNATFQWFEDLEKALLQYRDLLGKNGLILFSLFGSRTFLELNECLGELLGKTISTNAQNFIEQKRVEAILRRIFKGVMVEDKIYKEKYTSLPALLKKIKYTGVRGQAFAQKVFWSQRMLQALERIYRERYQEIVVTYQAFFCQGRK